MSFAQTYRYCDHRAIVNMPWGERGFQLQILTGTTDGEIVDDSVSPLIVNPEPTTADVPILTLDGTGQSFLIGSRYSDDWSGASVEGIVQFRSTSSLNPMAFYAYQSLSLSTTTWGRLRYNATSEKFEFIESSTTHSSDVIAAATVFNGDWHDITVQVTTTTVDFIFDGSNIGSLTGLTIVPPGGNGINFGLFNLEYFEGDLKYVKFTLDYATTPDVIFESHFMEGAGYVVSSENSDNPTQEAQLDPSGGGLISMWNLVDNIASGALLNGFGEICTFNGINERIWLDDFSLTRIDEIKIVFFCTGEDEQVIWSPGGNFGIGYYVNYTLVGPYAFQSSNFLGGTLETSDISELGVGWHTIELKYIGASAPSYQIYLDGSSVNTSGTFSSTFTPGDSSVGWAGSLGYNDTYFKEVSYLYGGVKRYVIKDGHADCTNIGTFSNWIINPGPTEYVAGREDGNDATGYDLIGDGGYVQNQADVNLMQQATKIVDGIYLTYGATTGFIPWVTETSGRARFEGPFGTGNIEISYSGGQWIIFPIGSGTPTATNILDGPLPPTTGGTWSQPYIVQHGYEGSLWADEDGEYLAATWDDLICNQAGAHNLAGRFIKNSLDNCQLEELIQTSMEEQFTEAQVAQIATYQGNSGCQLSSTAWLLDGGTPYRTTNGSLYIIGE